MRRGQLRIPYQPGPVVHQPQVGQPVPYQRLNRTCGQPQSPWRRLNPDVDDRQQRMRRQQRVRQMQDEEDQRDDDSQPQDHWDIQPQDHWDIHQD